MKGIKLEWDSCKYLICDVIIVARRRDNAVRLEEKEKKEKAILSQIIEEADEYKVEFYRKRVIACENNVVTNREREKVSLEFFLFSSFFGAVFSFNYVLKWCCEITYVNFASGMHSVFLFV